MNDEPRPELSAETTPSTAPVSTTSTAADKTDRGDRDDDWQPRLWSKIIILLLIVGYLLAFVASNNDEIEIDFLVATVDIRLLWLILGSFALGLFGGVLLSQLHRNRRARAAARVKK